MDTLFCLTSLRKKTYIEFIHYRLMNKGKFGTRAEGASIFILGFWIFFSWWYSDIGEFTMPFAYLMLVLQLLFQKLFMFGVKITLFPISILLYLILVCICKRKCSCYSIDGPHDEPIDWYHQLGLDPPVDLDLDDIKFDHAKPSARNAKPEDAKNPKQDSAAQ